MDQDQNLETTNQFSSIAKNQLHALKLFFSIIKAQFNTIIKALQSNYEGYFKPFTKYISELGISHGLNCLHIFHQNDTVERKHKHIMEFGLTLLSHSYIFLKFWDHSFGTLVHIINRISTAGLVKFHSIFYALYHKICILIY